MITKLVYNEVTKRHHLCLVDENDNNLIYKDYGSLEPNTLDVQEAYEVLDDEFF